MVNKAMRTTHCFVAYLLCLNPVVYSQDSNEETFLSQINKFDENEKSKDVLEKLNKPTPSLPYYLKDFGTQGVNFDVDANGKAYIMCDVFNTNECRSNNGTNCDVPSTIKCFQEDRSHLLACMGVVLYNPQSPINKTDPKIEGLPMLKGCWRHGESEIKECATHDECVVDTRRTGDSQRAAKFCCCRTHNCNRKFSFTFEDDSGTWPPFLPTTQSPEDHTLLGYPDYWIYCVIIFFCTVSSGGLVVFLVWYNCRHKIRFFRKTVTPDETAVNIPLTTIRTNQNAQACFARINGQEEDLTKLVLKEEIARGRFCETHIAEIGTEKIVVKLYNQSDTDSWVNETDTYSIRPMRQHDNIAEFIASFEFCGMYYIVTAYVQHRSLYDYLQEHVVTLSEGMKIIAGFLNGLAFLHEEKPSRFYNKPTIVHRDVKSKNVLIKDNMNSCLTDFSLAIKFGKKNVVIDELKGQVGTRRYMSPEVLEGATEFAPFAFQQIDVYAASLVMWEVLERVDIASVDKVPSASLPYETEAGLQPTLGRMREIVVLKKIRPHIRKSLRENKVTNKVIATMIEMWEMEPDGRVTSGCARDRIVKIYEDLTKEKFKTEMEIPDDVLEAQRAASGQADNSIDSERNDDVDLEINRHHPIPSREAEMSLLIDEADKDDD